MLLLLLAVKDYAKKVCWLAYELLLLFLVQDFLDRVIFDIAIWNINDTIGLCIIGIRLLWKIKTKYALF